MGGLGHPWGMKWIIPLWLCAAPAFADTCPAAADHSAAEADLYAQLQALDTPVGSRELNNQLWMLWVQAPDEKAQALLDDGMRMRESYNLLGARNALDQLVDYCPDYAEGYNQRAFANFLDANYAGALYDLDIALGLSPNHTGALTGKGLTLMRLDRKAEAIEVLQTAIDLNPWLSERALLEQLKGEEI